MVQSSRGVDHPSPGAQCQGGLDAPITDLKGVASATEARLQSLGIGRVRDLLFHLPLRYIDQTRLAPIHQLQPGQDALIEGTVADCQVLQGRRRTLRVWVEDETGILVLRFFHFYSSNQQRFRPGVRMRCYGQVRQASSALEMVHPECRVLRANQPAPLADHLHPVYPSTSGLSQFVLRRLVAEAIRRLRSNARALQDYLPREILQKEELPRLAEALELVHYPPPGIDPETLCNGTHAAVQRLAFEELLSHRLGLLRMRAQSRQSQAFALQGGQHLVEQLLTLLPFALTKAQRRVIAEITQDLRQETPMMRLLQGDVGSGKTVVAAAAALCAVGSGHQAAVMAPTELLATQHYKCFQAWLEPLKIPILSHTGRISRTQRESNLDTIRGTEAAIVIGTHALIQEDLIFQRLALAIIDEQHRFGVDQRLSLLNRRARDTRAPHQMIMTATPIPRTLSMTLYADLDLSVIDELPPGRKAVNTVVLPGTQRPLLVERIGAACEQGRQVYWVCNLIEDSENLQKQSASTTSASLKKDLPQLQIGLIHGKMKQAEKEQMMQAFLDGKLHLLVATTIIEVGIDVPAASLMVIEDADQLGLSQLHQLRGRIGRGDAGSDCVLLYTPPLESLARDRLEVIRSTQDGFKIAESDLRLRGPGEMLGARQKGLPQFRIADLARDRSLLPGVHDAGRLLNEQYPERVAPILERWQPFAQEYIQV